MTVQPVPFTYDRAVELRCSQCQRLVPTEPEVAWLLACLGMGVLCKDCCR